MSYRQKNILIWGDDTVLMCVIEQSIKNTLELTHYSVLDRIEYGHQSLVTADVLRSADIVLYGLFCRHETRVRAEGIPALGTRLWAGKLGLVYGVGISPVASNPLIWDVLNPKSLATKIANLDTIPDPLSDWKALDTYFSESIFSVDGHV